MAGPSLCNPIESAKPDDSGKGIKGAASPNSTVKQVMNTDKRKGAETYEPPKATSYDIEKLFLHTGCYFKK
jgi:hypothetical protein